METPHLDSDKAIIERRYNEFHALHKHLRKECPQVMKRVPAFPKKKFFGNSFQTYHIEDRCRLFEKYLRYLYHQDEVIGTKAFKEFFIKPHLKQATGLLKCEQYNESCTQYQLALHLQKKLGHTDRDDMVTAMCGVIETCKNMKDYKRAMETGNACLEFLNYDLSSPFLLGLMQSVMDARKREMVPLDDLKVKFRECLRHSACDPDSIKTLRELLVRRF